MKILPGPASIELAENIAKDLQLLLVKYDYKEFYDGETYLRITDDVLDEEIIIVQSTHPPQEKHFLELIFLSSTLKELGAQKVIAVVPYLCYARADKRKLSGEVLSHQLSLEVLSKAGVDTLLTINVHNPNAFQASVSDMERININMFEYIGSYLKKDYSDSIIIGPDKGAEEDVKIVAQSLNTPYFFLEKKRDAHTHEIIMTSPDFDCENKAVILIDDVITSGGTAKKASQLILDKKPSSLVFVCVHAMSQATVYTKMKKIGVDKIISTNTVPSSEIEQINISNILCTILKEKYL